MNYIKILWCYSLRNKQDGFVNAILNQRLTINPITEKVFHPVPSWLFFKEYCNIWSSMVPYLLKDDESMTWISASQLHVHVSSESAPNRQSFLKIHRTGYSSLQSSPSLAACDHRRQTWAHWHKSLGPKCEKIFNVISDGKLSSKGCCFPATSSPLTVNVLLKTLFPVDLHSSKLSLSLIDVSDFVTEVLSFK